MTDFSADVWPSYKMTERWKDGGIIISLSFALMAAILGD